MSFFVFIFAAMNKTRLKKIWKWFKIIAVVYVLGGIGLYFLQDYILFHPVSLKKEHAYEFKQPHRDITIPVNLNEEINLVDFLPTDSVKKGLVLYFHGNKKNISWYAHYMPMFTNKGYEVMMIDYPGFGKSKGRITEKKSVASRKAGATGATKGLSRNSGEWSPS